MMGKNKCACLSEKEFLGSINKVAPKWGMATHFEDEPYGAGTVSVPKGHEPCDCWRGKLILLRWNFWRAYYQVIDIKLWFKKTPDESQIPF